MPRPSTNPRASTVDRVLVLATKTMDQHLAYVALSRHRDQVTVYAPKSEFATFEKLTEALGRSGAKTTTLDFENEANYARAIDAFAQRRGIETLASIAPTLAATIERQRVWIESGRARLSELWQRAERAIGMKPDREATRTLAPEMAKDEGAAPEPTRTTKAEQSPATRSLAADIAIPAVPIEKPVSEIAREALMGAPEWTHRTDQLRPKLAAVFRDPDAAMKAISNKLTQPGADPRLIAQTVAKSPEAFGAVRGSPRLRRWPGRATRACRCA